MTSFQMITVTTMATAVLIHGMSLPVIR
jgi:hypothetical protein